jgi:methionyl-tRNA synthetase
LAKEKILITAALPYANGNIHLGHLSGAYLPADIYARYNRLKGNDILFVCGSDEHGVPITLSADKEKVSPQVIIDRYHESNKKAFDKFGMSFDIYSRTSLPVHHETAKEFFLEFYSRGMLKEKKSQQFYDEKAGMFLPDRYVEGVCPNCGYDQARSDECENCGALYEPHELKKPVSKVSGERPVLKETSHWFLPLGDYQKRLEDYVNEMNSRYGWKENVMQYCRGWFKSGLQDRAITRDIDWGVSVPLNDAQGKVIYVWFEAVLGYISAAKELSEKMNDPELWRRYWQDKETKYVAFIGKDNVVFHCIIFPAILMGWNDGGKDQYILPQNVPANEFLNFEGKKFSKSRNWGIDVEEFLEIFPADPLRYTLAANLPETRDTDFYWKEFQARNNNELADILGNFINRTFTFVHKHFEGKVPDRGKLQDIDKDMINLVESYPSKISEYFENYKFRDGVLEIMNLARAGNKYFNDVEPWKTVKSDRERCATTLNICLNTIYTLAELFHPVIPDASERIFRILNAEKTGWDEAGKDQLKDGHELNKAEIIFRKIEDSEIEKEINKLNGLEEVPVADEKITIDDFMKVHLKTAKILHAEKVPKSNKLLKLKVKIGEEERQIIAGVAEAYNPEELTGRTIVVVSNLKPAKLMGMESNGMLLAAHSQNGLKVLFLDDNVEAGVRIK